MNNLDNTQSNRRLILLLLISFLGIALVFPVLSFIPSHPDEHQFYFNAFRIMNGEELHNYLHVALTEYLLAIFLSTVNLITDSGVNFPQGDPSAVTYYYGKVFGFLLYIYAFILGAIVLQRRDKRIKLRTVVYAVLYFGSIGLFERFLRVNSDSIMLLVYLNFVVLSFWFHKKRATLLKFFVLNTAFLFLGTFTNLKSVYLLLPLLVVNTLVPFFFYVEKEEDTGDPQLSRMYKFVTYSVGVVVGTVLLWVAFIPRPFNPIKFWYGVKKTIVHGTKFDFDYPSQAHNSWLVYIYDFFVEYIGLAALLAIIVLFVIAYKEKSRALFTELFAKGKRQLKLNAFKNGNLYQVTEIILLLSFVSYYVGVSSRVIHWSRWGAPLGLLGIMASSVVISHVIRVITSFKERLFLPLPLLLVVLFVLSWSLRLAMTLDLYKTGHSEKAPFIQTVADIENFLEEKNIPREEARERVAWFTGYAGNVNNFSLEKIALPENQKVQYLFWPFWNIGLLYTDANVDKETHNQREFVNKYGEELSFRFPSLMSYYMHYTKLFAWRVLNITWNPEIDSLVENQYGVVKLKGPVEEIELSYDLQYDDLPRYTFPLSQVFNMKHLKDGYMFPPCYSYPDAKSVETGINILPPPGLDIGGRTAGLYCHSARFRVFMKGTYRIRVTGLPENVDDAQRVYFSASDFEWDPRTKTAIIEFPETRITAEFGIATEEEKIPDLEFHIFYVLGD